MSLLFSQLGISWGALLAQGTNFLIVLVVLWYFVYRPLARIVDERRVKIEKGLADAKEADDRLGQISEKERAVLIEAEKKSLSVIKKAESEASLRAEEIRATGEKKAASIIEEGKALADRRAVEKMASVDREIGNFVKQVVAKTVELDPKLVDEKLINEAVSVLHEAKA